jgi:hypothetical protein
VEEATYLTNSAATSSRPESTLIVPPRKDFEPTSTEKSAATKTVEATMNWQVVEIALPPVSFIQRQSQLWTGGHPAINDFVKRASGIDGVRCLVVEEVDEKIVHLTTFADPVTEEVQQAVYAVEAAIIDTYPESVFDFHLRVASETESGTPVPVPGQRFFAIWGNLDEKSASSYQASRRK